MNWILLVLSLGFTLALSSCISLQELTLDQCQSTKWQQKGVTDAMAGEKYSESETTKCAQVGVKTAKEEYLNGFTEGIQRFCTSGYGQKFALEGNIYKGSCPSTLESAFLSGYNQGKLEKDRLNLQQQQLTVISNAVQSHQHERRACTFDSDCVKKDVCDFNSGNKVCRLAKKACTFDSDCEVKGVCDQSSCRWK